MPDEDELGSSIEEVLHVDALMGWDGDPCACAECDCPRFRDGSDDVRCRDCAEGRHWPSGGASA